MDAVDYVALRELVSQGRMTWAELAQRMKLSSPAAAERVRRLEERGVIKGYGAVLDRDKLGHGFTAFVGVDLAHGSHRAEFLARVASLPEVLECHHVTGDHDYLLKLACRSPIHLDHVLNEDLKQGPAVARTRTLVVLSSPKEALFSPPPGDGTSGAGDS